MPDVSLTINGRIYKVACGPGEEERLLGLAADLERRVGDLVRAFGQVGEGQLLVAASLLMADELDEARTELAQAKDELAQAKDGVAALQNGAAARAEADDARRAAAIEALAERIEAIAVRIEGD